MQDSGRRLPDAGSDPETARPKISVVIPAYNEEECIEDCVAEVCGVMDRLGEPYEVIVVNDGSRDRTLDRLKACRARFPRLRVASHARNCGETAGLGTGFRLARGEVIATVDADLQNDPEDIPRMLPLLKEWDVVSGIRAKREDSFVRRVSSRVGNGVRNWLTRENITDVGCTMRVFKAHYVRHIQLFTGMHRFLPTLLRMEGARLTEMPVNHRPRTRGQSKYGVWNRVFRGLYDIFGVRWMQARWIRVEVKEEP